MTRRDTIMIAVLINAGILVVLFTSALKNSSDPSDLLGADVQSSPLQTIEIAPKNTITAAGGDEVDQMLKAYAQNGQSQVAVQLPTAEVKPNFAADLNAIAFGNADASTPLVEPPSTSVPEITAPTLVAPQVTTQAPNSSFTEVRVKKGDVLEKIARTHHTSVDEIMRANELTSTRLRIGQVLKVPTRYAVNASPTESKSTAAAPQYYTVKNGDSPWAIAHKNHIKLEQLLKLNNLDDDKARRLKPGDKLRIR